MVNQTTRYALQILGYLARAGTALTPHEQIAREIGVPANYLSKILTQLRKSGVVESRKGWGGGSRLLPEATGRPLVDIVRLFARDESAGIPSCAFGLPECRGDAPCPLHDQWTRIRDSFQDLLCKTTVGDLQRGTVRVGRSDLGTGSE
ncbi:MAG: Rrf2 family transcriptional regulator [Candidatus Eisenbacteria bacterium]|nr:Rrf2 family transcriptional regulator [Candidatus Eisenbacteria bacterium]MCC7141561.1 Rrf2 family transcriptional regulator [Candidatus Eisenbacteria bacterium]